MFHISHPYPTPIPRENGKMIPAADIVKATLTFFNKSFGFNSTPTMNRKRTKPNVANRILEPWNLSKNRRTKYDATNDFCDDARLTKPYQSEVEEA
ncbi:17260_t:CDS:2, partial [Acaulospora colombiana]